jgi:hypothetical protein
VGYWARCRVFGQVYTCHTALFLLQLVAVTGLACVVAGLPLYKAITGRAWVVKFENIRPIPRLAGSVRVINTPNKPQTDFVSPDFLKSGVVNSLIRKWGTERTSGNSGNDG